MNSQYVFGEPYLGWLLRGVAMTLALTVGTTIVSLLLGIPAGMARASSRRTLRWCAACYIILFRNVPLVPFLLFLTFALPSVFKSLFGAPLPGGVEFPLLIGGIALNTSGYIADIIRAGLRAIPQGQHDAARVLGLSPAAIHCRVLLPQGMRIAFPALSTRLIHNMKNSSVAAVLPLAVDHMEVVGQTSRIAGQTFAWAEPLLFAAATYLALAMLLGLVLRRLSARFERQMGGL